MSHLDKNDTFEKRIDNLTNASTAFILFINLFTLGAFIIAGWPEWWVHINYERSALTWFSSVQLSLIGVVCLINFATLYVGNDHGSIKPRALWFSLGLAYFYLSLDERLQIHERLREGVFKPHDIGTHLPGIGPGDFMLVLYAIAGLVVAYHLFGLMKENRRARAWFLVALILSAVVVVIDAKDPIGRSLQYQRVEQFIEELLETFAQMSFLVSFATIYLGELKNLKSDKRVSLGKS